ncbi:hypothetical protein Golax_018162 [Gossypium laxum]|uniref:Uncharacterized protein n=1 Tax=Gossypium laxum TaxID=34288 RepID=A0A7J8Z357_9ROSI|nr:hypothetical protein [Gossypium laxum]
MAKVKSFIELGLRKDKFESFKPKEMGNDEEKKKEDENGNGDNGKYGDNKRPPNRKWRPNNRPKGLLKCFLCDNLYMVSDYSKKFVFSAIERDDELDKASIRLGSIVRFVKAKSNTLYPIRITESGY